MSHPLVAEAAKLPQYRCTFSLPRGLATDISAIAKALRVSQSALLAVLLTEPIEQLSKLVAMLPLPSTDDAAAPDLVRRMRGQSVDLLRSAVSEAISAARELDPGFKFDAQD